MQKRKVKILKPEGWLGVDVSEEQMNNAFETIQNNGGTIVNVDHLKSRQGYLETVVIEYVI